MRVATPGGARLAYYDRAQTAQMQVFQGTALAPHAATQRWIYTVPTARKAFLSGAFCSVNRATAAAPQLIARAYIENLGFLILEAKTRGNVVGDKGELTLAAGVTLLAGDAIRGFTVDTSTGGTVDHATCAQLIEFAA